METWKSIDANYQVSSLGRVRSNKYGDWRILAPTLRSNGYLSVGLSHNNRIRQRTVHSLVAEAFIGPRPDGLVVMHKDDDKTNNKPRNLHYGTHGDNSRDAVLRHRRPRSSKYRGVRVVQGKTPKWRADVWANGIMNHVGTYVTEVAAAVAVNHFIKSNNLDIPLNKV